MWPRLFIIAFLTLLVTTAPGCGYLVMAMLDPVYYVGDSVRFRHANGIFDVSGRVTDADGDVLDGVKLSIRTIKVTGKLHDWSDMATCEATTEERQLGADGAFAVHATDRYRVELTFSKPGYLDMRLRLTIAFEPITLECNHDQPRVMMHDVSAPSPLRSNQVHPVLLAADPLNPPFKSVHRR
jgi:hypothetical protein